MKIEIITSVKAVSLVNLLLLEGVRSLRMKPDVREHFHVTENDLTLIENFRVKLGRALLKQAVKKADEEYKRKERKKSRTGLASKNKQGAFATLKHRLGRSRV